MRVKVVNHPRKYSWTSYHYYAHGEKDPLIDAATSYLALGDSPKKRQITYREMVRGVLISEGLIKRDYSAAYFIGDPDWVKEKYEALIQHIKAIKKASQRVISTSPPT